MLINELPDDCLLTIFDYLDYLDDLVNCYKVCIRWSFLIAERTKKVKYFMHNFSWMDGWEMNHCVYYRGVEPIDGTCLSTLFSNLKFAEINYSLYEKVEYKDIVALVRNQESLEGLTGLNARPLSNYRDEPEMVSFDLFEPSMQHNGSRIKQIMYYLSHIELTIGRFAKDANLFPNLERLNFAGVSQYYNGPVLEKLKIIELCLWEGNDSIINYSFQIMDSCPNLQSAHITVHNNRLLFDIKLKLQYLQDLVISFNGICINSWNDLKRLFMKYPNLKNLALRDAPIITDEHIEQLVHILPNLVLFDASGCRQVTQRAADYVQNHCKRYGRSIKFYFNGNDNEIKSDWPQLSNKTARISPGFDFMKHCFFKDFYSLSDFLIPIDY